MKIFSFQPTSGYSSEKNERQSRVQASKAEASDHSLLEAEDDLALTGKKTAILNSVREANTEAAYSAPSSSELSIIRQKLMSATSTILNNPAGALSAQANLTSETVAGLIC